MARINLGVDQKVHSKTKDFCKWVKGRMAEMDESMSLLASYIGITKQCLSYHLKNSVPFDQEQMIKIFRYLQASDEDILKWMRLERE